MPHATIVLTRRGVEVGSWLLLGGPTVDLSLVDDVARWQLAARRLGCTIRLREAGRDLVELLDFVGLGVEVGGQPEGGEEVGVEEAVEPRDPTV